jgi:hypothetical protein
LKSLPKNVRFITAFDGTEDDVVDEWQFGHLTVVRMSDSNDDNFTYCTAVLLNICEFEAEIVQNIFSLYIPPKVLVHLMV